VLFVDEMSIAELNSRFLGKDGPTDVLAFPIDEEPWRAAARPIREAPGRGCLQNPRMPPSCSAT